LAILANGTEKIQPMKLQPRTKVLLIFFLLGLFLQIKSQGSVLKDFNLLWNSDTNFTIVRIKVGSRSLNGYQTVTIRKINGTSEDFISMTESNRLRETKFGKNIPATIQGRDSAGKFIARDDEWAKFYDLVSFRYTFNGTIFVQHFGTQFIVEMECNFYTPPFFNSNGNFTKDAPSASMGTIVDLRNLRSIGLNFPAAYRAENIHPAIYSISAVAHIILTILTIIFSYFQPLRSHGFVPIIAITLQTLRVLHEWFYFVNLELNARYYCYNEILVKYPTILTILLVIPLNQIRYILMFHLNYQKSLFVSLKNGKRRMRISIIALKILSKPYVSPIIMAVFYFLIAGFFFVLGLIFGIDSCDNVMAYNINSFIYLAFSIIMIVVIFLVMLVDIGFLIYHIILKTKTTPLQTWQKILFPLHVLIVAWKEDIYYFRFQVYFIGLLILAPLYLISSILNLLVVPIANVVIGTLLDYAFVFMLAGFLLIITIFKLIYKLCTPKLKQETTNFLETLFKNDQHLVLLEQFSKFAIEEFSGENVACFKDINLYKKLKTHEEREEKYKQMHALYFNGVNSELEVFIFFYLTFLRLTHPVLL
jgi:hypothetical protein